MTQGFRGSGERPEAPDGSTIDPVCGMAVEWATARFTSPVEASTTPSAPRRAARSSMPRTTASRDRERQPASRTGVPSGFGRGERGVTSAFGAPPGNARRASLRTTVPYCLGSDPVVYGRP
jgi:hypothetical protein